MNEIVRKLQEGALVVDRGLLKRGGRRELDAALERHRAAGFPVRMLLLSEGADLAPWRRLWDELGLDEERDLLLLFNGRRWEARGFGLSPAEIARVLDESEADLGVYWARGLVTAADRLVTAAKARGRSTRSEGADVGALLGGGAVGLVALGGLFAWIAGRRRRLAQEREAAFAAALESARRRYSELMLAADALDEEERALASELQLKAARLHDDIEVVRQRCEEHPEDKGKQTTLGRLAHLENELAVVATTVLQRARKRG